MSNQYRKKPVVIEARQFNGAWTGDGTEILNWMGKGGDWDGETKELRIHTLEGVMTASKGDWIIKGIKGEFYPCKPDIFAATYEDASAPSGTPSSSWHKNGEPDPHSGGHYDGERAALVLGHLTDDELANGMFMNYDQKMDIQAIMDKKPDYHPPIVWATAAKERIRWLSRTLEKATGSAQ